MIYLRFSDNDQRCIATPEEWKSLWHWGAHEVGNAPEVYHFVESGVSKDIPALSEQLAQAAATYPPKDAATRQRVKELRLHLDRATSSAVCVTDGQPEQPSELHKAFAALHNLATQQQNEITELRKQLAELVSKQFLSPVISVQMPPDGIHLAIPTEAIVEAVKAINWPAAVVNVPETVVNVASPVVNVPETVVNVAAPVVNVPAPAKRSVKIGKDQEGNWVGFSE